MKKTVYIFLILGVIFFSYSVSVDAVEKNNQCVICHKELGDKRLISPAITQKDDAHGRRGVVCVDCHGGDSSAEDMSAAMDPAKGFVGKPPKAEILKLCSNCHADSVYSENINAHNVLSSGKLRHKVKIPARDGVNGIILRKIGCGVFVFLILVFSTALFLRIKELERK